MTRNLRIDRKHHADLPDWARRQVEDAERESERIMREHHQVIPPEECVSQQDVEAWKAKKAREAADTARSEAALAALTSKINAGEELFALQLRAHRIPFEREYAFHQSRRWRLDFAILETKIGIEIEGAIWKEGGGGHSHPLGIEADIEKSNALTLEGWRLLRLQPDKHVKTGKGIDMVLELLGRTQ